MSGVVNTTLLTFGPEDETRNDGNLTIEILGGARAIGGDAYDRFSPALFDHLQRADVVHCHQIHATATTMAAEFCRRTGKKVFVTDLGGGPGSGMNRVNDELFDAHLHISRFSQSLWRDHKTPSVLISGGVDSTRFHPADVPPAEFRAVFVGRILPHKGIDVLLRALPDDMPLDVIGRAYDARYLEDLYGLASGKLVSFITGLDDDSLPDAYRRASCVVLPSVYRTMYGDESFAPELLGQTLLEGMATGLPAICTEVGAMPEVVVDGVTGFVVPGGDVEALGKKLEILRADQSLASQFGSNARKHVLENFNWAGVVSRCLREYES
jgi:glycosyltransferase involved in cell wall biosynthesis